MVSSTGRIYCRQGPNEEWEPINLASSWKFGGGSIMVWGVITLSGVGALYCIDGKMDAKKYISILQSALLPTIRDHEIDIDELILVQDNNPKHTAGLTEAWFETKGITTMDWPAHSPDMDPIEHVWNEVNCWLRKQGHVPSTKDELWKILEEEWMCLPNLYICKLYESMPN